MLHHYRTPPIRLTLGTMLIIALSAFSVTQAERIQSEPRLPTGQQVWTEKQMFDDTTNAWELMRSNELEASRKQFESVIRRSSNQYERSQALLGLAQTHIAAGDLNEATRVYERIIEIDSLNNYSHYSVMIQLASIYSDLGQLEKARYWIDQWQPYAVGTETTIEVFEDQQRRVTELKLKLNP